MDVDFYRIEDFDRNGPYRYECWPRYNEWDKERHPGPYDDGLGHVYAGEVFGFQTMEMLRDWFDDEILRELSEHPMCTPWEFRITHYIVDERQIRHGSKQSVALQQSLVYAQTIDIAGLLQKEDAYA